MEKQEFMQSSMGYSCSECPRTFLVGFTDKETGKKYCSYCASIKRDKAILEEKIY